MGIIEFKIDSKNGSKNDSKFDSKNDSKFDSKNDSKLHSKIDSRLHSMFYNMPESNRSFICVLWVSILPRYGFFSYCILGSILSQSHVNFFFVVAIFNFGST